MILIHGTTRSRAVQILRDGPRDDHQEPGGLPWPDGFSMALESGPFHFGTPETYARNKDQAFPDEGGPVILAVDVPEQIIQAAADASLPLSQGLVQFDTGYGLEELLAAWPTLTKEIRSIS